MKNFLIVSGLVLFALLVFVSRSVNDKKQEQIEHLENCVEQYKTSLSDAEDVISNVNDAIYYGTYWKQSEMLEIERMTNDYNNSVSLNCQ